MTQTGERRQYYNLVLHGAAADIFIYGDITSWPWLPSDVSSYRLASEIAGLDDVDIINVYINSYGGEVAEALAIYAALCRHPAKVITHCDGFAASAASVVFMAGDERYISPLGQLMIHEVWSSASGNAADLRKAADQLEQITESAAKAYADKVKVDADTLGDMLAEETWIDAEDALAMGFATAIEAWNEKQAPLMAAQERIMAIFRAGLAAKAEETPEKPPAPLPEGDPQALLKNKPQGAKTPAKGRKLFGFK